MKYRCVLADPPWTYKTWSPPGKKYGRAEFSYPVQDDDWILKLPVQDVCEKDCTLLLWATSPKLPEAFDVMKAWGFTYKSKIEWVKLNRDGSARIGLGYHVRAATESLLIGQKGKASVPVVSDRPCGVIFCGNGEHSRKPDTQYEIAENYPGPYLEMFARPREDGLFGWERDGWTHTGNEVTGLDMRDDLARVAGL